ncbi:MAG: VWA-like domain-containing protein [Microthrixaceae bacterium]|nr:hypothetical protein [Actinomycetota bacterium]HMS11720.1 VWA-like domain-containing protein [Microthrixaceae bacterium]HMT22778.1 VWA-like domain-containing protein [Microthrixaceae bacterium]HMT62287.1 VWA-like domain-containing protein [Microthrixaceae bacterium]
MKATRTVPLAPADAEFFGAARLRAARMQPYLASAVFSLIPVPVPGYGTFGVDRWWRVYVDMDQARAWGVEATAAVLLHEANHVLRDHHGRADRAGVTSASHHRWNLAGDAAINDGLLADGLPLPDPVLPSTLALDPGGLEETYFRQLGERAAVSTSVECGSGSGGERLPVELDDDTDEPAVDDVDATAIRRGVAHEVTAAQVQGIRVSPGLALWAKALLTPQVSWRSLLRSAVGRPLRAAYGRRHPTWQRPDRRGDSRPDFPSPGSYRERPEVAVVIDTSASMSTRALDAAVTELDDILRRLSAEITVIACDQHAVTPQRIRRLGQLELTGGGGTDLRVGIAAAAELRPAPTVTVVLTDGWTPWPVAAPARSCLVAVVIGDRAPLPVGPGIVAIRIDEP